jgi:Family of unknown function (DUF6278)
MAAVAAWSQAWRGARRGGLRTLGFAQNADGLNGLVGRWPALLTWAGSRGLALSGVPDELQLLDHEIGEQPHDAAVTQLAGEIGLFLGTVIINSSSGAQWSVWPNGHPIILTESGHELDVVAHRRSPAQHEQALPR